MAAVPGATLVGRIGTSLGMQAIGSKATSPKPFGS